MNSNAPDVEQRLARLTEHLAEILQRWMLVGERQERAVGQLEAHLTEWDNAGTRLQGDSSQRMHELERIVRQEWNALREIHNEPVRQLRQQATSLTEVCIATANAAEHGFDRAEVRLAAIESDLHQRISELTREVHALVTDLRARSDAPLSRPAADAPAWSLDGVTRLHNQLRDGSLEGTGLATIAVAAPPVDAPSRAPVGELAPATAALSERVDSLERALTDRGSDSRGEVERGARVTRAWRIAVASSAIAILAAGGFAWRMQNQVRAASGRAEDAQRQSQVATEAATRRMEATRADAAREIAAARDVATKAQAIGDVLAAPDLVRINLSGGGAVARPSAQVLWSRARGVVFSGSRLPVPPAGAAYQIWLLTRGEPVSAGTFRPDEAGKATIAIAPPPVPRPVVGAIVTLEPETGSSQPSGQQVLARVPDVP